MSESSHAASRRFVKCPACGTKLGVRAEDAGQRGQCRQCGQVFCIGGPASPPQAPAGSPPAPPSAPTSRKQGWDTYDNDHLHPVSCLVCQTLMYATDDQVGTKVKCPDCGAVNLATRREAKKPKPSPMVADGDEYQLDESSAPPPTPMIRSVAERESENRAAARERLGIRATASAPAEEEEPPPRRRPKPVRDPTRPAIPVLQGSLPMMFTAEVSVRWFALSFILMMVVAFVSLATGAMGNQALYLLPVVAGGCIIGGFWLLSAASLLVAILTQSANGADELSEPPSWFSMDLGELGFVALGAMLSAAPAWLATKLTPDWPWEATMALGAAVWLAAFPFMMLSALEQGSPLAFFSPRIAASLGHCFFAWLAYYVVACALVAGAGYLSWLMITSDNPLATLPLAWLITAVLLMYVRIVGRLGWWLADVMPAPADERDGPV